MEPGIDQTQGVLPMPYSQPITKLVRARFSCRTYLERPLEPEVRQRLADFAASTQSGPLGTEARFELFAASATDRQALKGLGTYGFIQGAAGFIIGATRDAENGLEDFGFLMERIVLYATDLGLGTCWLGGSFTKSSFAAKIRADNAELVPAVAAVGYMASHRSVVDRITRFVASSHRRLPWEQIFFDGDFDVPLLRETAGDYKVPLEMVRLGPSAYNRQPWRILKRANAWHFYLQRPTGYRDRRAARISWSVADMQRLDMGIAMCHFELSARELGVEGRWVVAEPGIRTPGELTAYTASWVNGQA
jgi:nitroreductase